jgi:hypothetical protein
MRCIRKRNHTPKEPFFESERPMQFRAPSNVPGFYVEKHPK